MNKEYYCIVSPIISSWLKYYFLDLVLKLEIFSILLMQLYFYRSSFPPPCKQRQLTEDLDSWRRRKKCGCSKENGHPGFHPLPLLRKSDRGLIPLVSLPLSQIFNLYLLCSDFSWSLVSFNFPRGPRQFLCWSRSLFHLNDAFYLAF